MTKSKKGCIRCNRGFIDGGCWVWCQHEVARKAKHYRGDNCGGCKYYKRQRENQSDI